MNPRNKLAEMPIRPLLYTMAIPLMLSLLVQSLCADWLLSPMPSDLSFYPAVVLFLPTASELPLPVLWLPYLLPEGVLQLYPVKASPDTLNFDGFSDNLYEENYTCQVAPSAHRIYR